ncbi:cap-specific mRNA (nucleoside-2'-O-)-methyltransferase 1-like [Ornithodoros turicata]|uniref:cap-specific mRNA (nucleoside-2'-O-)-methyltransferase 1-like n=1 Tax=Ornithodoros turicata TaxID=34597 RepID=UPI003139C7E5
MTSMFKAECLSDSSEDSDGGSPAKHFSRPDSSDDSEGGSTSPEKQNRLPQQGSEKTTMKRKTEESSWSDDSDGSSPVKRKLQPTGPIRKKQRTDGIESSSTKSSHFIPCSSDESKTEDEGDAQHLGSYSSVSLKLMKSMGYKSGKGLGKSGQGITDIIEASKQRGRRGLGLIVDGFEPRPDVEWDFTKEKIDIREEIKWLPECTEDPPDIKELRQWPTEGAKKLTIDDETTFCDPEILGEIISCKSVFDGLEPEEMRRARTRSNPFETIRGGIFQNRAAMKMANIDAAFDFMFTDPRDQDGESLVASEGLLYFADVCAGPGGFSEYVLWRKGWQAKGFGFTLKGPNDFKLEEFFAGPPDTFQPYYGVTGDGDVFVPENLRSFSKFVKDNTDGGGVHFVMADGGFSVEGQENIQEILSKRLYLCQFCAALSILRTGGHFVCKLFDIFTPFSVGLVYLMYRAFRHVCIFKPNTSRPANSERYIVCKWRRQDTKDIQDYMYELCCRFEKISSVTSDDDITDVVPLEILNDDQDFFKYIKDSNEELGRLQVVHLSKIKAFAQNANLYEERQSNLRKECLELWKVPDQARAHPKAGNPSAKFKELTKNDTSYFDSKPGELTDAQLRKMKSVYDYRCLVCGEGKPPDNKAFYLGLGRKYVYQWSGNPQEKWNKVTDSLELPADTLFYGETVQELEGEGRHQKRLNTIHVIDALVLGKKVIKDEHYDDRIRWINKFVKAISKPNRHDLIPLRVKEVFRFEDAGSMFERLCMKLEKGGARNMRLSYCLPQEEEEKHFYPSGMLLLRTTKSPWYEQVSRSSKKTYYYNMSNGKSIYERPTSAVADFKSCFTTSLVWLWQPGIRLLRIPERPTDDGKVHKDTILAFIEDKVVV